MHASVLMPETLTIKAIAEIFEAAYYDVQIEPDDTILLQDRYSVIIGISESGPVILAAVFSCREDATRSERLELANRINGERIAIRASVNEPGSLVLDWYIPIRGSLPSRTLVMAARLFQEVLTTIFELDTDKLIE